ncbi:hypothetical protein Tco_1360470 [Tanacetum coccineum]
MIKQSGWNEKWHDILDTMSKMPCTKSIMSILRRIVLAACVYYIWNERNSRLFGNGKKSYKDLLKIIVNFVRIKVASLIVKNSSTVTEVSKQWQVIMNIRKESEVILEEYKDDKIAILFYLCEDGVAFEWIGASYNDALSSILFLPIYEGQMQHGIEMDSGREI